MIQLPPMTEKQLRILLANCEIADAVYAGLKEDRCRDRELVRARIERELALHGHDPLFEAMGVTESPGRHLEVVR